MATRGALGDFLTVLLGLLLCTPFLSAELMHFKRNREDADKYLPMRTVNLVKNDEDAKKFLSKYDYLSCTERQTYKDGAQRETVYGELREQRPDSFQGCQINDDKYTKAIELYQEKNALPVTGTLDSKTKEIMSQGRCGVPDIPEGGQQKTKNKTTTVARATEKRKTTTTTTSGGRRRKRSFLGEGRGPVEGTDEGVIGERRKRYLDDTHERLMNEKLPRMAPRMAPRMRRSSSLEEQKRRRRRSPVANQWAIGGGSQIKFNSPVVRWRLSENNISRKMTLVSQRKALYLTFRMWSEVIPVKFVEDRTCPVSQIDILIGFGTDDHMNCDRKFDGPKGEIAHSWVVGNIHIDDAEDYRLTDPDGLSLVKVCLHEIGHVLDLAHTSRHYSVMFASFNTSNEMKGQFELGWEDRREVQKIYGVCKGSFDVVFDWIRRLPDGTEIYNTYFFRGAYYWMYQNNSNRTRYGDPEHIGVGWKNLPNQLDAFVNVHYVNREWDKVNVVYFFKGSLMFEYDSETDKVKRGFPKNISEAFGPKPNSTYPSIPNNLDTAYFDKRDKKIYFFKDHLVYTFDPLEEHPDRRGCCEDIRNITEVFPTPPGEAPVQTPIDAAYFSWTEKSVYFFKAEDVWVNTLYRPRALVRNLMKYVGKWYHKPEESYATTKHKWFDICDVGQ